MQSNSKVKRDRPVKGVDSMGQNQSHVQMQSSPKVIGVVLAAGQGTRMKSTIPKVLHKIAGKPMILWVLDALDQAGVEQCLLVTSPGYASEMSMIGGGEKKIVVVQKQPRGTGDAVASAALGIVGAKSPSYTQGLLYVGNPKPAEYVLICAGDTPSLSPEALRVFIESSQGKDLQVLGMQLANPFGYGRLLTEGERLLAITEEKDCSPIEKQIQWVNTGIYCVKTSLLFEWLEGIRPENAQKEYYLTDIVRVALSQPSRNHVIGWAKAQDVESYGGVNDRVQLAEAERLISQRIKRKHMLQGVRFLAPETIYIDYGVRLGVDAEIGSGCVFLGPTDVGDYTEVGHHVTLRGVKIGSRCRIGDGCILERLTIQDGEWVPPGTVKIGTGDF